MRLGHKLAKELITSFDLKNSYALADKGYNSKELVAAIQSKGGKSVISSRRNASQLRKYDKCLYKDRFLVEKFS